MKAIAVFNNKGGVGKTTLLCNVASYFKVKKGQRVLIVDADPQCNATIYLFSPERINQFYNNSTQKSLYHIIQPYKKGKDIYQPMKSLLYIVTDSTLIVL